MNSQKTDFTRQANGYPSLPGVDLRLDFFFDCQFRNWLFLFRRNPGRLM